MRCEEEGSPGAPDSPESPEEGVALLQQASSRGRTLQLPGAGAGLLRSRALRGALVAASALACATLTWRAVQQAPVRQRLAKGASAEPGADLLGLQEGASSSSYLMCSEPGQCEPNVLQWRSSPAALSASVPGGLGSVPGVPAVAWGPFAAAWQGAPPTFRGRPIGLDVVGNFMRQLLSSDPFGAGDSVPYVRFSKPGPTSKPKVVAITQRQLAFLVANVLMGNDISAGNGLSATIGRCAGKGTRGYLYSLVSLLAVLSQELAGGQQGKSLVGATPKAKDDSWKLRLEDSYLNAAETCAAMGGTQNCADFMAGGTGGQALTDIAGTVVGGGGGLCDLANSQDESLMVFYPEVLAFVFFAGPGDFVPVPWTLLGARRYLNDITGNSDRNPGPTENKCGWLRDKDWLNQNMPQGEVEITLGSGTASVYSSAFVAVASKSSQAVGGCPMQQAVNNNCDSQRHHVDEDLALWYQAYEPTMYLEEVQDAIRNAISRIGTGPWGAGVWYGDSQQYFLTVWLGTALLSGVGLDYYIYDHFCENPGNQCFVLGANGCSSCVASSGVKNVNPARCGTADVHGMMSKFTGKLAKELYLGLKSVGGPPSQVFDLMQRFTASPADMAAPVPGAAEAAAAAEAESALDPTPSSESAPTPQEEEEEEADPIPTPATQPVPQPYVTQEAATQGISQGTQPYQQTSGQPSAQPLGPAPAQLSMPTLAPVVPPEPRKCMPAMFGHQLCFNLPHFR